VTVALRMHAEKPQDDMAVAMERGVIRFVKSRRSWLTSKRHRKHVACHGYVTGVETLEFKEATHVKDKADSTKKALGKAAWPSEASLWEAPEIGYGHMSE